MARTWLIAAPVGINATGDVVFDGTPPTVARLMASGPKSGTFESLVPTGDYIVLDGGAPIPAADLPASFEPSADSVLHVFWDAIDVSVNVVSARIEFPTLSIDILLDNSDAGNLLIPITTLTRADVIACEGQTWTVTLTAAAGSSTPVATMVFFGGPPAIGCDLQGTFEALLPQNPSPNINAGPSQFIDPPLPATVTSVGTFENAPPAGAAITYLWEFVSGPTGATAPTITNPTSLTSGFIFSEKLFGLYTFRLTSSGDPAYGVPSSSDILEIFMPVPKPPVVQNINVTVTP